MLPQRRNCYFQSRTAPGRHEIQSQSINQSINRSIDRSIYQSINQPNKRSINYKINQSINQSSAHCIPEAEHDRALFRTSESSIRTCVDVSWSNPMLINSRRQSAFGRKSDVGKADAEVAIFTPVKKGNLSCDNERMKGNKFRERLQFPVAKEKRNKKNEKFCKVSLPEGFVGFLHFQIFGNFFPLISQNKVASLEVNNRADWSNYVKGEIGHRMA